MVWIDKSGYPLDFAPCSFLSNAWKWLRRADIIKSFKQRDRWQKTKVGEQYWLVDTWCVRPSKECKDE